MGYWETLELLQDQLKDIQNRQDYLKKQRNKAIKTKKIAEELNINIRNACISIKKLLKKGEIEEIRGIINKSERFYILTLKHFEENILCKQKK